jgi:tetratricopeptide (TPR) repeat protein
MTTPRSLFVLLAWLALLPVAGTVQAQSNASAVDQELGQRHYRRGNTYNNLERFDEAIAEYQLSVTADPDFADSYRNLANLLYFQNRYVEAIPIFQRFIALQKEPSAGLIAALNTLGQLLRDERRFDEALPIDLQAIVQDPKNSSQIYVMGNTYFNAGYAEAAAAAQIYTQALLTMPEDAYLHRSLGRMYEDMGRLEEALTQYQAAAAIDTASDFYKDLVSTLEARLAQQATSAGQ